MGKEIGRYFKYNRSKISTPTLKKPVLSSSGNHTSYTTNPTRTIISYQLENEDITAIQNTSDISNADDIHSFVTPRKQNTSVQETSTPPLLTPLITNYLLRLLSYRKQRNYPQLVNNICVSRLTANILILLNVSDQGY